MACEFQLDIDIIADNLAFPSGLEPILDIKHNVNAVRDISVETIREIFKFSTPDLDHLTGDINYSNIQFYIDVEAWKDAGKVKYMGIDKIPMNPLLCFNPFHPNALQDDVTKPTRHGKDKIIDSIAKEYILYTCNTQLGVSEENSTSTFSLSFYDEINDKLETLVELGDDLGRLWLDLLSMGSNMGGNIIGDKNICRSLLEQVRKVAFDRLKDIEWVGESHKYSIPIQNKDKLIIKLKVQPANDQNRLSHVSEGEEVSDRIYYLIFNVVNNAVNNEEHSAFLV